MTKLLKVLAVLAVLTFGVFALPAMAQDLFNVRIIECGAPGTPQGCGSNPATGATEPTGNGNLGNVRVQTNGIVRVTLNNATPNQTYCVFVGNWETSNGFQFQFIGTNPAGAIGTIKTDGGGDYGPNGSIDTIPGGAIQAFDFPDLTKIGQPNFAFNRGACPGSQTVFTTGFRVPNN
jgi:hypothetical protein